MKLYEFVVDGIGGASGFTIKSVKVIENDGTIISVDIGNYYTFSTNNYFYVMSDYKLLRNGTLFNIGHNFEGATVEIVIGRSYTSEPANTFTVPWFYMATIPLGMITSSEDFDKPPHHCTSDPRFNGKMNNYKYPGVPPKGRKGIE